MTDRKSRVFHHPLYEVGSLFTRGNAGHVDLLKRLEESSYCIFCLTFTEKRSNSKRENMLQRIPECECALGFHHAAAATKLNVKAEHRTLFFFQTDVSKFCTPTLS